MTRWGWLTQDAIPDRVTVPISLPNSESWRAQFLGAFLLLTQSENWEEYGTLTPDEMALEWLEIFLEFVSGELSMIPVGSIIEFGGDDLPSGFLWARGQDVSRETYSALFAVYGERFGSGNNSTTFTLPDRRQRVGVGYDESDPLFDNVGASGGEMEVMLTLDQIPSHSHSQVAHTHLQNPHNHTQDPHSHTVDGGINAASGAVGRSLIAQGLGSNNTLTRTTVAINQNTTAVNQNAQPPIGNSGGNDGHTNMQPYLVFNYIIKY